MRLETKPQDVIDAAGDGTVLSIALTTSQALRVLVGMKLAPLGLASGQDRFLLVLEDRGPLSVSALADALGVRPSTVSKMMDRLAARGYAERSLDELDARRTTICLTDDGRGVCERLRSLHNTIGADLMTGLDGSERQRLIEGLELLKDAVGRRLKRLR